MIAQGREGGRRLHPLTPLLGVLDRNLLAPGVLGLGSGQVRLLALALVVLLAASVLRWRRRTWSFEAGVLRVESGVFARSQQVVRADRVQQVTVVQKLRHRLLGLASLRVEVAGGDAGIELEALREDDAARLRADLLGERARTAAAAAAAAVDAADGAGEATALPAGEPAWVPAAWPVVHLGFRDLALAGVTGAQLLVVFVAGASALQLLGELPGSLSRRLGEVDVGPVGPVLLALLVVGVVAVVLASAVGASVLRDGGYELSLVGDELHLRRGLLDRKEAVLPLARIQAVRVTASPLRRLVGSVSMRLQGAGSGTDQEERRVVVPILPAAEVDRVLRLVLPGTERLPELLPAPPAARRRAVVRALVPALLVAGPVAAVGAPLGALALLALPLAVLLGLAAYRGLGHARLPGSLVSRTGALVRTTVVVPRDRAQSVRRRASPLQRRAGLATLAVDLAGPGRSPRVVDQAAATTDELAAWLVAPRR